ncbi:Ribonuclease H-like domain containing protein [Parasponia andersonii]|uniref:Ribonuclease H-like domain containing protein n=1 Tax=Parasponia andersonii TaxID=3476 RepID=A0A2P5CHD3_PARAD|nr:Ribonuclease H-like domain containing protein [Parasponia andersonii]
MSATTYFRPAPNAGPWSPPSLNQFKLNVDAAAVNNHDGEVGIGAVMRGSRGQVYGAMATKIYGHFNPLLAECLALREGTSFAVHHKFFILEIESDSKNAVEAFHQKAALSTESPIIYDTIFNCSKLGNVTCKYIPRSRNIVAHNFAKYALRCTTNSWWCFETPHCVYADVLTDIPFQ